MDNWHWYDTALVAGCWALPFVAFAFKAWTDYSRRNWEREDAQMVAEFVRSLSAKPAPLRRAWREVER